MYDGVVPACATAGFVKPAMVTVQSVLTATLLRLVVSVTTFVILSLIIELVMSKSNVFPPLEQLLVVAAVPEK